ncbi:MAG TPA: thioredoxin [Nitrososphaerales archaeon]|nr:thioredoxin [Nitrososphaerales archaeon]
MSFGEGETGADPELERIKQRKLAELMQRKTLSAESSKESNSGSRPLVTSPIELSEANFFDALKRHELLVVDFWAPWCGPCRMVSPVVEQLAREYAGKVTFGKLNVDENPNISSQYRVQGIPTILIFKNGRVVDGIVGAVPKSMIESKIRAQIGPPGTSASPYH